MGGTTNTKIRQMLQETPPPSAVDNERPSGGRSPPWARGDFGSARPPVESDLSGGGGWVETPPPSQLIAGGWGERTGETALRGTGPRAPNTFLWQIPTQTVAPGRPPPEPGPWGRLELLGCRIVPRCTESPKRGGIPAGAGKLSAHWFPREPRWPLARPHRHRGVSDTQQTGAGG